MKGMGCPMPKSAHKIAYDSMLRRCKRAVELKQAELIYRILDGDDGHKLADFPTLDAKWRPQLMAILDSMVPTGPEPAVTVTSSDTQDRSPEADIFACAKLRKEKAVIRV